MRRRSFPIAVALSLGALVPLATPQGVAAEPAAATEQNAPAAQAAPPAQAPAAQAPAAQGAPPEQAARPVEPVPPEKLAHADIKDADGEEVGHVRLTETPNGLIVVARFSMLSPGTRGFHIHEVGKCEPSSFESAGPHFNPGGEKHGFASPGGEHAGDLPNLEIPNQSDLEVTFFVPDVTLTEGENALFDDDGAALVVHEQADDYKSDPAGGAGDRIACGILVRGPESGADVTASLR